MYNYMRACVSFRKSVSVYLLASYKKWILEAIIRESAGSLGIKLKVIFIPISHKDYLNVRLILTYIANKRSNKRIFFVNQNSYFKALVSKRLSFKPHLARVFFTHYSELDISKKEYAQFLNLTEKIFTINTRDKNFLVNIGIDESKIEVVYGAVDRKIFYPMANWKKAQLFLKNPYILIVGDCKERKNPVLLLEVIKGNPKKRFIIHGRGWSKFIYAKNGIIPENLEIIDFEFKNQPKLMREASVYMSLSRLEGGPYPTLEALASGTPVIVTDTGWNSEIVNDKCGIVVPVSVQVAEIAKSLDYCFELKKKIWNSDLLNGKFVWSELGKKLFD